MTMTAEFCAQMEAILRRAGQMLLSASLTEDVVHQKEGMANFVTNFDIAVQQFLIGELQVLLPGASFFGEEETEGNDKNLDGYCFYIDPIDGTTNFIFGYQHSCISVGLSYQRRMIAGFVYNPYTDAMYQAVRGQGAYMNGKRLVLADQSVGEGIVAFGCARYNEGDIDLLFDAVKELFLRSLSVRCGGSGALDLCRVAAGANVAYLELKLQPYDYAAASVLIEEAGGEVRQVDGGEMLLDGPCSVLSGTKKACAEIRALLEELKSQGR